MIGNKFLEEEITGQEGKPLNSVDLTVAGAYGWSPVLGKIANGKNIAAWINNQGYIPQNIYSFLVQSPLGFDIMPNGDKLKKILKALIEIHAQTIKGIDLNMTGEYEEHDISTGIKQHEFKRTVMGEIKVTYEWIEKFGKIVNTFWVTYFRYLLGDHITGQPLVCALPNWDNTKSYSADYKSFSVMYVEPDVTRKKVQDAVLITNHMPESAGTNTLSKDAVNGAGGLVTQAISLTGIPLYYNKEVNEFAGRLLQDMSSTFHDPNTLPSFLVEVKPDVATGYGVKDTTASA